MRLPAEAAVREAALSEAAVREVAVSVIALPNARRENASDPSAVMAVQKVCQNVHFLSCVLLCSLGRTGGCGLPVAIPVASEAGLTWVSSGLVYRRPATLGGRAARSLDQVGEVAGGVEVTIGGVAAVIAGEGPFGQAQFGSHHAAVRTGFAGWEPPVGDDQFSPVPGGFVGELPA